MITANDVLHAWALPSFGVKRDAVPGRINETWFKAEKVGTYYGQCSELCGIKHAFMPIEVRVVTEEEYKKLSKEYLKCLGGKVKKNCFSSGYCGNAWESNPALQVYYRQRL